MKNLSELTIADLVALNTFYQWLLEDTAILSAKDLISISDDASLISAEINGRIQKIAELNYIK